MSKDVRKKILEAASEAFSAYGYDKTTVEDIAKMADKAKTTFYYYFEGKAEIFSAALEEEVRAMQDGLSVYLNPASGNIVPSLRDYLKLCVMLCIPFVCILIQGDLGSGIVVFVAGAVIIMMGGPKKEWVLSTIGLLVGLIVLFFAVNSITTAYFDTPLIAQYRLNRL